MPKSNKRAKEIRRPRLAAGTFGAFAHRPTAAARAAAVVRAAAARRPPGPVLPRPGRVSAFESESSGSSQSSDGPAPPPPIAESNFVDVEDEPWNGIPDSDDPLPHWSDGLPEVFRGRPLVQRALAMPVLRDIPIARLPDTTQPQVSYVDASLVHERGELPSPQRDYCTVALSENPGRKVPHFLACVVLEGWFNGGCINCHWHNTNLRCSFRPPPHGEGTTTMTIMVIITWLVLVLVLSLASRVQKRYDSLQSLMEQPRGPVESYLEDLGRQMEKHRRTMIFDLVQHKIGVERSYSDLWILCRLSYTIVLLGQALELIQWSTNGVLEVVLTLVEMSATWIA